MVSSSVIPWYNRPARELPAKRWLRQRYGFTVPTSVFARLPTQRAAPRWRPFPALVWVEQQSRSRAAPER